MNEFLCGLVLMCMLAAVRSATAENLDVLPKGRHLLHTYLLGECQKHFDARRKSVETIKTPEQALARQTRMRTAWTEALGPFPRRTPLKPEVVGALKGDGYRIEKVLYESRPNHHVTAALYVPTRGKGPFPGVLVPCGHSRTGKAEPAYQSISILLVLHGFVVLCYDPIGQGERCQLLDESGKPLVWGTTEHTMTDVGARLVGRSVAAYRIWDGIRSLDYLASRPEVDPKRLGCTGNSGGGTMTSYLMATDPRVACAAPSCFLTSVERLFATIGPQDGEQNIPAQVARGIEHADMILLHAPKPTLLCTATYDFFDIGGSWTTFREAKRLYGILGHTERLDIVEYPDKHGFSQPRREAALRWMRRGLQGIDDAPTEPELTLRSAAELQVTKTGQVVHDRKGVTVWDLNQREAKRLEAQRKTFWATNGKAKCVAEVRRLLCVRAARSKADVQTLATLQREGCSIEKLIIQRKNEVPVPALLFAPTPRKGSLPGVLYIDGRGKSHDARPGGAVQRLVADGHVVLSIDCRGFGETRPEKPKGYWHAEYPIAFLGLHLGRPLLGQQVEDALAAVSVLAERPETNADALTVVGIERGGPVALHAAALDARVVGVTLHQSIKSWTDVVHNPKALDQLLQIVPNALAHYDLPNLLNIVE